MVRDLVAETDKFVKQSFIENPHYSFNDWSVMYNHSVLAKGIALRIAKTVKCDKLLVSLGALLHDIGKAYKAEPEVLHTHHEAFNLTVCKTFLENLDLPGDKQRELESIVSYQSDSAELKVIEDADALALYADKRLYMLFIEWAVRNHLGSAIQRKLDKFSKLNFDISKELGKAWFEQMKLDWGNYIKNH